MEHHGLLNQVQDLELLKDHGGEIPHQLPLKLMDILMQVLQKNGMEVLGHQAEVFPLLFIQVVQLDR